MFVKRDRFEMNSFDEKNREKKKEMMYTLKQTPLKNVKNHHIFKFLRLRTNKTINTLFKKHFF